VDGFVLLRGRIRKEDTFMSDREERLPDTPDYSVVVPVYNEAETLPELRSRLTVVLDELDGSSEVVLVDDGSRDASWDMIEQAAAEDPRFRGVRLSRNFGHQIAVSAGLDQARGRAVVIIDADLQDPPEVILAMASKWRAGYDVVYAVRDERLDETRFKLWTARIFYRVLRRLTETDIPADVGDFRLVDRRVVDAVAAMPERSRFLRGMFAWVGFEQTSVSYRRDPRFAGTSKYPLSKMLRFAADGVVNFSNVPLRLALNLGFIVSAAAFILGLGAFVAKALGLYATPGWASVVVATSFLGGMQLVVLGVMGEYVGRIYDEVKGRPLYFVARVTGAAGPRDADGSPRSTAAGKVAE
jgi:glycosyltransferase involved in cell wall biosynthesis